MHGYLFYLSTSLLSRYSIVSLRRPSLSVRLTLWRQLSFAQDVLPRWVRYQVHIVSEHDEVRWHEYRALIATTLVLEFSAVRRLPSCRVDFDLRTGVLVACN